MSSTRPHIVVLDDSERALRRLADWGRIDAQADVSIHHAALSGAALVEALKNADVIVLMRDRTPFTAELLAQLPKLRYLVFTGTRNARLDLAALAARNIPVSCTEFGPSKDSTCELTWGLILAVTKQLASQTARLQAGQWRSDTAAPLPGALVGQRLGLIGLGEIGGRVAKVGQALGMDVVAWSPRMTAERAAEQGVGFLPLDELLASSQVVSLHLVVLPSTRHVINAQRLALMQPGSLLVNTSRSELIDTQSLVQALQQGRPGFAALDVFDVEPLPLTDPLRQLPNVLLTPHLGFVTEPVFQRFATGVTECLQAWLDQQPLVRVVAPAA
ncbi:D-2-hydroxyacid dehydrogenase family protein [Polaromonas sp. SM01]|uniref:D-2-hydroxyacid dehydrogenase family protein n=1 Tax=Polaromonas sp. SM01 TaxID=3085630 RepID=UPI0029824BAD|nr:D-2-hydroxyacid dehydrogenase family protein [Polaromonas sp. SM01]MDW5442105.1 D-2-hydroxyacid dehydrogenase family protein [Polaromonas sp. SM01]